MFEIQDVDGLIVVRDDLVPGGTKARILRGVLNPGQEYVYAGPVYGYAQVALAHACRANGAVATVFVARRREMHSRTAEAKAAGARVVSVPNGYLSNVRAKALAYCDMVGATMLPFGLDAPIYRDTLADMVRTHLPAMDGRTVWSVAGSGTLTRALQAAWPRSPVNAVRISGMRSDIGRAIEWIAPEKFEADAAGPLPPFPSCSNYDAKAWRFIMQHAQPGDVFWNVAP